jgi:2'-5' RNA ligase
MSTYRTFIAIEIPPDIRRRIKEHIDQLRAVFPDVRASWTREDNLHLTLRFLGDVPIANIPALSNAVAEATHEINPFDLTVRGCGAFPPHGRPKVLWIGCADIPSASHSLDAGSAGFQPASSLSSLPVAFSSLHTALEDRCAAAGFEGEPRPFHPHLTVARLRESRGSRALAEHHKQLGFPAQTFTVSELVVFRSELSSKGSKHTALARHRIESSFH